MTGAENMALDEALMARARRTGESVLRVYSWSEPTLSLGRHQRARDVYLPALAREQGVAIVRRMTGGRALLHHREVTYSVTAPADDGSLHRSYRAINDILLLGLTKLGVAASPALPATRTPQPTSAPGLEEPATGELVVGGRKLVGSAQLREDRALLQHGSILIDDDQSLIVRLAAFAVGTAAPAATLHETMGRVPAVAEVAAALFDAVRERQAARATPLALDEQTIIDQRHAAERYRSDEWTWRR